MKPFIQLQKRFLRRFSTFLGFEVQNVYLKLCQKVGKRKSS